MNQSLLIATNGSPLSLPALEYGLWLAKTLRLPVILLGIIERNQHALVVESIFQHTADHLAAHNLPYKQILERGDAIRAICQLADARKHLLILGPLGRPGWLRWLRGRTFRHIVEGIQAPLIYAPLQRNQLKKTLVCMGGLGYAKSVADWAIYLARCTGAHLTILHVVEQVYFDYPVASQIQAHREEILQTDTPQARNLLDALHRAQEAGIPAEVKFRHGDIIHEIEAELQGGDYDMVALGSQGSAQSLRHLFLPNVTAEIAESSAIPVLTARLGQGPIFQT